MTLLTTLRSVVLRPSFGAALICVTSLVSYACGGGGGSRTANDAKSAATSPRAGTACVDQVSLEDCVDYAVEREAVVELLGDLEDARDQRSIEVAEAALRSRDPVIIEAGLRLIGPFARSHPRAAEVAVPHVTSPRIASHQLAARIAAESQAYGELGRQYRIGHVDEVDVDPWAKLPIPELGRVGFKAPYPGSAPYAPCDSPTSVGFATADPVDRVLAHYRTELARQPTDLSELDRKAGERMQASTHEMVKKMQILQEEYARTQDPKVFQKMDALGKQADTSGAFFSKTPFPEGERRAQTKVFVVEEDAGAPQRIVVVYREPRLDRSIVMMAWSAPKYPPLPRAPKPLNGPAIF